MNDALWLPCTQMQTLSDPPCIKSAHGATLLTTDNRQLIDGISSWWVNLHGHGHPRINSSIVKQLCRLEHTLLGGVTHPPILELAEKLSQVSGFDKVFFADSGSAAVEVALKMSLQFWQQSGQSGKTKFLSLEHGYHGETLGALSVTDIALFSKQFKSMLVEQIRTPSPSPLFAAKDMSAAEHEAWALKSFDDTLKLQHESLCAVIIEPLVQGASGMAMYSKQALAHMVTAAKSYGLHVIFDEIAVGFGRTGELFAFEHLAKQSPLKPDFVCLSKGLTAGYLPMSAVLTTNQVFEAFLDTELERGFLHSHSFTGNPLAAAAALASLRVFEEENSLGKVLALEAHLRHGFNRLAEIGGCHHPRVIGGIGAISLQSSGHIGAFVAKHALQNGLFVRPIGNHVYLMPPYCISEVELEKSFEALHAGIGYALKQSPAPFVDPLLTA